jgi:hypothetical protein
MQAYRKIFWLFLFLFGFLASAEAAVAATLYQAEVPVASYSPEDFQKALGPALKQTLVKVTGNSNIAQDPTVRKALSKANGMVQTFNYVTGEGQKSLMLQVHFSSQAIDDLLKNANPTTHATTSAAADKTTAAQTTTADIQSINMVVSGVKGLPDFTALLAYLRQLAGVVDVNNKQTRGDRVLLVLKLNQGMDALAELISHDNKLIKESANGGANPAAKVLRYRWVATPAALATAPAPVEQPAAAPIAASPSLTQAQPMTTPPPAPTALPPIMPAQASVPPPPQTSGGAPISEGVPSPLPNAVPSSADSASQAQSFAVPNSAGGFVSEGEANK